MKRWIKENPLKILVIFALIISFLSPLAVGEKPTKGKNFEKKKYGSVTGVVKSIDIEKKSITLLQKLQNSERSITFEILPSTKIYWQKTKMKVDLGDINPGVRVIIQFYETDKNLKAARIILPGGMKEAAQAILKGTIKGGDKK